MPASAATASQAADQQHALIRGEEAAAAIIAQLATSILELDRQLNELEKLIADRFRADPNAEIITSMTGIGDLLGAEFLAAFAGTLSTSASADHFAGYAV